MVPGVVGADVAFAVAVESGHGLFAEEAEGLLEDCFFVREVFVAQLVQNSPLREVCALPAIITVTKERNMRCRRRV